MAYTRESKPHAGALSHHYKAITVLAVVLITCCIVFVTPHAYAEEIDTNPEADKFQQEVERSAVAYDEALAEAENADAALEENKAKIAELEKKIPEQRGRSEAAAREMYKFEQQSLGILDFLLSADNFYDFIRNLDYVNRVSAANVAEANRLVEMMAELDAANASLEKNKEDADARARDAERALAQAQEARMEAQRRAEEAARQAAEAEAAAKAASEAAKTPPEEKPAPEEVKVTTEEPAVPASDGADWSADETTFVNQWAPRIDAYLAGSALEGQGRTFAAAAWEYGVDPRWSPAISYTESSKGEVCFLPHNAWGWGSESWGSWEEAINDHVRGLARGYGYTISMEAAQKYCPPNSEHWYETTLAQMESI